MCISILWCLLSLLRRNQWTERRMPFTGASRTWSGGAESTASSSENLTSTCKESTCTKYIQFYFKGKCICRDTFMFVRTISQKWSHNLFQHFASLGWFLKSMVIVIIHLTTECLLLMFKLYCSSWRTLHYICNITTRALPGHKHKALLPL